MGAKELQFDWREGERTGGDAPGTEARLEAPYHRHRAFGMTYHPAHVRRLLHALQHSVHRNEQAIKAAIRQVDYSV